jgi:hypothetical protein
MLVEMLRRKTAVALAARLLHLLKLTPGARRAATPIRPLLTPSTSDFPRAIEEVYSGP